METPHSKVAKFGTTDLDPYVVLIVLASFLLAIVAYLVRATATPSIVCGSLSLTALGAAASLQMTRGRSLVGSLAAGQLGPWFATSAAIVFGIASLIWVAPPAPFGSLISTDSVRSAMVVVAGALVCFTVGYSFAPKRPITDAGKWVRRLVVTDRSDSPAQQKAWLLAGFSLAAYLGEIAIGRFGYLSNPVADVSSGNPLSQLLFVVGNFSVLAVALSANDYARKRGRNRLVSFLALLTLQSIVGAFSASKEVIALGFVAALFGYVGGSRRVPIVWLAVAFLTFVFLVVPLTTTYRSEVLTGGSRLSPIQVVEAISARGLTFFLPTSGGSPATQTLQRISRIGDVAIIVQRTKSTDINYRPVTELLEAPLYGLVPRILWPGKPVIATGYEFSQQYYGTPPSQYTSAAITPEGDLWRHGGWLVLVVGMLLFGAGVRLLDSASAGLDNAPLRLMLVLTFFPMIVKHEADAIYILASIPSLLVGVAIASRLAVWSPGARRDSSRAGSTTPHVVIAVNQPIQHFSASFRCAALSQRLRLSVLYWGDNSNGVFDPEFNRHVSWDVDMLSGYSWGRASGSNLFTRASSFIRSLEALDPDVVVSFGWASPAARSAVAWCLIRRRPLFFYGDTSWQDSQSGLKPWIRRFVLRAAFHSAAGALSSGTFNREFYIYHGMHPRKVVDGVYPIDVASYTAARDVPRAAPRKLIIGFGGKLIARKGVDELLRALAKISDDDSWQARIIGDGEERERLVSLSQALGIEARVEFRGFRNTSEMPVELAACDIVVVPSKHDNRGMVAAEAMAAGAAVIVSSATGVWGRGDLVQDGITGRVYRSGDPRQLADIMVNLLHSPAELAALQDEGAKVALRHGPDYFTRALEQAAANAGRHD